MNFLIYGGHFDPQKKQERIEFLESEMNDSHFWDNTTHSTAVINELNALKKELLEVQNLRTKVESNLQLLDELKNAEDIELQSLLEEEIPLIQKKKEEIEISVLLSEPYDIEDALLEIHPGAGGTESCDWANMLYRMYTRWCTNHNFKYEVLEFQEGEEAGIKSVTLLIHGLYAYGYLKNEKGIHRLVRISPFDSNARRHTSFASVEVTPYFKNEEIQVDIDEKDLKIDVYRSSGHGGQGVNTTDSAVRITHLPTKIVVTCQNERSQIQNKARCMDMLKRKLFQLEIEKKEQALKNIKGELSENGFGSQIRSYVMHPYSLVKDHRTKAEMTDVQKVLDGHIDHFIYEQLKKGRL